MGGGHWGPHFSLGAAPWPPVEPPWESCLMHVEALTEHNAVFVLLYFTLHLYVFVFFLYFYLPVLFHFLF